MTSTLPDDQDVLTFWFTEARDKWWSKDPEFDDEIRRRFSDLHEGATRGALKPWRRSAEGRLAEIIVLDQFSRNMFRDRPEAFSQDERARQLTYEAIECGADMDLPAEQRAFLYMPLMHSESASDHEEAVRLYSSDPALADNLDFEIRHQAIIDRFGRYPHRNAILGRESTAEEVVFLQQPGSSF